MSIATTRYGLWALTIFSAVTSGLMAGIFFAFSNFLMKALDALPFPDAIAAMQSINEKVLNPGFAVVLVGPALCSLVLAIDGFACPGRPGRFWLISGCALYLFGVILVTARFNVPLNHGLEGLHGIAPEMAAAWKAFRAQWQTWNHLRTVAALAASVCFWIALTRLPLPENISRTWPASL